MEPMALKLVEVKLTRTKKRTRGVREQKLDMVDVNEVILRYMQLNSLGDPEYTGSGQVK